MRPSGGRARRGVATAGGGVARDGGEPVGLQKIGAEIDAEAQEQRAGGARHDRELDPVGGAGAWQPEFLHRIAEHIEVDAAQADREPDSFVTLVPAERLLTAPARRGPSRSCPSARPRCRARPARRVSVQPCRLDRCAAWSRPRRRRSTRGSD